MASTQIDPGLWRPGDYLLHAYLTDMGANGQGGTETGQGPFVVPFRSRLIQVGVVVENSNGSDNEIDIEGLEGVKTSMQLGALVAEGAGISGTNVVPTDAQSVADGLSDLIFEKATYRVRSDGTGSGGPEGHFWMHMRPEGNEHIQYGDFIIISSEFWDGTSSDVVHFPVPVDCEVMRVMSGANDPETAQISILFQKNASDLISLLQSADATPTDLEFFESDIIPDERSASARQLGRGDFIECAYTTAAGISGKIPITIVLKRI